MKTRYLHISAYPCDNCEGSGHRAGSFGIRQTEISREGIRTPVGAVCLSCGNKQTEVNAYEYCASVCAHRVGLTEGESRAVFRMSGQSCVPYRQEFGTAVHR